jgi:hypothetical protein
MDFGFYPLAFDRRIGDIAIRTLDDLEENVRGVMQSGLTEKDWYYAPLERVQCLGGEIKTLPYPSRVFRLPKTHALDCASPQGEDHLRFLIQCFGFFVGMRMSDSEAGFLDAMPVKPGIITDMVWFGDSQMRGVGFADHFWRTHSHNPRIAAAVRGVIHNYFLSQTPTLLHFERFIYLYVALEGCHVVHALIQRHDSRKVTRTHAERIANLCAAFGMATPKWADHAALGPPAVVRYRNETLHEGLFFNEPFGFQIFGGNTNRKVDDDGVLLEMANLVCRLLLALLGMHKCDYVTSPIGSRQMHGVKV